MHDQFAGTSDGFDDWCGCDDERITVNEFGVAVCVFERIDDETALPNGRASRRPGQYPTGSRGLRPLLPADAEPRLHRAGAGRSSSTIDRNV